MRKQPVRQPRAASGKTICTQSAVFAKKFKQNARGIVPGAEKEFLLQKPVDFLRGSPYDETKIKGHMTDGTVEIYHMEYDQ